MGRFRIRSVVGADPIGTKNIVTCPPTSNACAKGCSVMLSQCTILSIPTLDFDLLVRHTRGRDLAKLRRQLRHLTHSVEARCSASAAPPARVTASALARIEKALEGSLASAHARLDLARKAKVDLAANARGAGRRARGATG